MVCCSSVVSVLASCFNSQFFNSKTSYSSVASENVRGMWFSGRQVKIVSQNGARVKLKQNKSKFFLTVLQL